jgi:hypothetical protein
MPLRTLPHTVALVAAVIVAVAVADTVGSLLEVAVTVTDAPLGTVAGAV